MLKGFYAGKVGVLQTRVLTNQDNRDLIIMVVFGAGQGFPLPPNDRPPVLKLWKDLHGVQAEDFLELGDQSLLFEQQRYIVCRRNIVNSNNLLDFDLTEHCQLLGGHFLEQGRATASNLLEVSYPDYTPSPGNELDLGRGQRSGHLELPAASAWSFVRRG